MRIILTGGGTGGHIYPALTIADALTRREDGCEILYVGTARGLEADLVPRAGLPFATVDARGLIGQSPGQMAGALAAALRGTIQARRILARFRPHLVVGTGGYVCAPVVVAAAMLGVPVALQEQNAFPSATNRLLSRLARLVFLPYAEARRHFPRRVQTLVTGNPVRRAVLDADRATARQTLGCGPGEELVLVLGGSQGARAINQAITAVAGRCTRRPRFRLLHVSGMRQYNEVASLYAAAGIELEQDGRIMLRDYLHDMPSALAAADLVVGRAGAMTLAELTARGLPAVLVPFPHAAHGHQEWNARVLEQAGAALVMRERDLTADSLAGAVCSLLDDAPRREAMVAAARRLGRPQATETIVEQLVHLCQRG